MPVVREETRLLLWIRPHDPGRERRASQIWDRERCSLVRYGREKDAAIWFEREVAMRKEIHLLL